MNKYRPDCRMSLIGCMFFVANHVACAAQPVPESESLVVTPVQWPETRHVEQWLAHEMRDESHLGDSTIAPAAPYKAKGRASQPATPAVVLVALYGVGDTLAADVRIGTRLHTLHPAFGARSPGKGGDTSKLMIEAVDGTCLRMRYRGASRKVCLDPAGSEGAIDAR